MTIVSSKDFQTNQKKYFDMAINEQIYVQQDDYMFHIICSNFDTVKVIEQKILKPDDNLHRGITKEEFKAGARKIVDKIFAKQ